VKFQGISYEITAVESLEKDQRTTEQLNAFRNRCSSQLTDYSDLNDKIETLRNSLSELTNDLNIVDLTLSGLENESYKDRHTSETAICKTYHVSVVPAIINTHILFFFLLNY